MTRFLLISLLLLGCAETSTPDVQPRVVRPPDSQSLDLSQALPPQDGGVDVMGFDYGVNDIKSPLEDIITPIEDAIPPIQDAIPPIEDAIPPIEDATPPIEDATPPIEDAIPPIEDAIPPIEDAIPPIEDAIPPIEDAIPPIEDAIPPIEDAAPTCGQRWADEIVINQPNDFTLGGQAARFHDPGFAYGFFHTFNGLQAGGVGDAPRKVHVLLPRRYEDEPSVRYPVVYMNDGQTVFWDDGPYEGKTWDAAARMSALTPCDIEPVILVAIYPLNVGREYTHARWSDDPDAACCAVEGYAGYLAETLKPFIDAHYRTQPQRALALGAAHGGLAAFITAALHPQAFPQAAALSPSFWAGLDIDHVPSPAPLAGGALLGLVEAGLSASRPKLWIDWGLVRDGQAHNDEIEARVAARAEELRGLLTRDYGYIEGVDLFTYADPEGQHEEASWGARLGRVLAIFYPAGDAG